MILKSTVVGTALLCLGVSAFADDAVPNTQGGRYVFSKQADGFVRLDTQSGEVSRCSQKGASFVCEAAPEDRALLENEIARLRTENGSLKKELLAHGVALPSAVPPEPPVAQNDSPSLHVPNDADLDRMVALAGRVWHRLLDAVDRAQKQVLNKS